MTPIIPDGDSPVKYLGDTPFLIFRRGFGTVDELWMRLLRFVRSLLGYLLVVLSI